MRRLIPILFTSIVLGACSSIDCPLVNTVYSKYKTFGRNLTLLDTLTVYTKTIEGNRDTILLNKSVGVDSFNLPMSYVRDVDKLYFIIKDTTNIITIDTVRISKANVPHFEAVDCALTYFHTLQKVVHTHHGIDSMVINHNSVTYDPTRTHLYIYYKTKR